MMLYGLWTFATRQKRTGALTSQSGLEPPSPSYYHTNWFDGSVRTLHRSAASNIIHYKTNNRSEKSVSYLRTLHCLFIKKTTGTMDKSTKYHDYANSEPATSIAPSGQRGGAGGRFPVRLHFLLTQVENDNLSHIVSWQPHGRCFKVHRQDLFVKQILPV